VDRHTGTVTHTEEMKKTRSLGEMTSRNKTNVVKKEKKEYECTCHVCGQTHKYKRSTKEAMQYREKKGGATEKDEEGESTSAPVTSVDRHTSTKNDSE